MPNYCNYEMKVKGSKKDILNFVKTLKADYNYMEGKPSHKHFFRVFEVYDEELVDEGDGTFSMFVFGICAWSVYSCMCKGQNTYYHSLKESHPDIFMGTDLEEATRNLEVEIFSEEEGMGFSEHYLYKNGECLVDDTCEIQQAGYTKSGKVTTRINWDTYDGNYTCINPHREAPDEPYRWTI